MKIFVIWENPTNFLLLSKTQKQRQKTKQLTFSFLAPVPSVDTLPTCSV
jgi:hypothetical protein